MSLPCAAATIPDATAAAAPPLEPPVDRPRSHGLWAAPCARGSVVTVLAISGVFVRPIDTNPALRYRSTNHVSESACQSMSFNTCKPKWYGSPAS